MLDKIKEWLSSKELPEKIQDPSPEEPIKEPIEIKEEKPKDAIDLLCDWITENKGHLKVKRRINYHRFYHGTAHNSTYRKRFYKIKILLFEMFYYCDKRIDQTFSCSPSREEIHIYRYRAKINNKEIAYDAAIRIVRHILKLEDEQEKVLKEIELRKKQEHEKEVREQSMGVIKEFIESARVDNPTS